LATFPLAGKHNDEFIILTKTKGETKVSSSKKTEELEKVLSCQEGAEKKKKKKKKKKNKKKRKNKELGGGHEGITKTKERHLEE